MATLLAIAGSYRDRGIIDQAVGVAVEAARMAGVRVDRFFLGGFTLSPNLTHIERNLRIRLFVHLGRSNQP